LKKLDKFIIKSFIGPYILSFFIAEFVLIMQFLWKWIDEFLGKGYSMAFILEMMFYHSVTLIPYALPISILLASVMVFGDISEKYELSSFKSAGISLMRIFRPAIMISILTFVFSLVASNYLKPIANFEFMRKFELLRKQKATLAIQEGVFNSDFNDLVVRVGKKEVNGKDMSNILIYDNSIQDKSLLNLIKSDSAKMFPSENGKYFFMDLKNGEQTQELDRSPDSTGKTSMPMVRMSFKTLSKVIDMSTFYVNESDIGINKNRVDMLNCFQLKAQIDTLDKSINNSQSLARSNYQQVIEQQVVSEEEYKSAVARQISNKPIIEIDKKLKSSSQAKPKYIKNDGTITTENAVSKSKEKFLHLSKSKFAKTEIIEDSLKKDSISSIESRSFVNQNYLKRVSNKSIDQSKSFLALYDSIARPNISRISLIEANKNLETANNANNNLIQNSFERELYVYNYGQQFCFAFVCILFLFIGAPLGSIIKKGGYGYPLLIAILFYILFFICVIIGKKLSNKEELTGWNGAWLPCMVLLPFSVFFTYVALKDLGFNLSFFTESIKTIGLFFTKKSKQIDSV
jgi:lipopolysaccharide export system permease protein